MRDNKKIVTRDNYDEDRNTSRDAPPCEYEGCHLYGILETEDKVLLCWKHYEKATEGRRDKPTPVWASKYFLS